MKTKLYNYTTDETSESSYLSMHLKRKLYKLAGPTQKRVIEIINQKTFRRFCNSLSAGYNQLSLTTIYRSELYHYTTDALRTSYLYIAHMLSYALVIADAAIPDHCKHISSKSETSAYPLEQLASAQLSESSIFRSELYIDTTDALSESSAYQQQSSRLISSMPDPAAEQSSAIQNLFEKYNYRMRSTKERNRKHKVQSGADILTTQMNNLLTSQLFSRAYILTSCLTVQMNNLLTSYNSARSSILTSCLTVHLTSNLNRQSTRHPGAGRQHAIFPKPQIGILFPLTKGVWDL